MNDLLVDLITSQLNNLSFIREFPERTDAEH